MLHISPGGPQLSAVQANILDDEFFLSDPMSYFSARIDAVLTARKSSINLAPSDYKEFLTALGELELGSLLEHNDSDRELQIAVEVISIRHHAAEALMRFLHAVVVSEPLSGDANCIWVAITDGPSSLHKVVSQLQEAFTSDEHIFSKAFFPPGTTDSAEVKASFEVATKWLMRSVRLLTDNELTLNAAHNKVKHGLAIRTRADTRIELVRADSVDAAGNIPLSAFGPGASIPIFDRPMVTYLARPHPAYKQGLEATSLRIDPPAVLAEAWMIAWVYASVFHVAAVRHLGPNNADIAGYPSFRSGPTPPELVTNAGGAALGYRGAVTSAHDDSLEPRPSGVFFPGFFQSMVIDFENVTHSVVVQ
jgi:exonuclease VII small subunit